MRHTCAMDPACIACRNGIPLPQTQAAPSAIKGQHADSVIVDDPIKSEVPKGGFGIGFSERRVDMLIIDTKLPTAKPHDGPFRYPYDGDVYAGPHPDLTDEQVADRVRMLMRHDLDFEPIVTAARDRIMNLIELLRIVESDYAAVAHAAGVEWVADGHAPEPGPVEAIVAHVEEMHRDVGRLIDIEVLTTERGRAMGESVLDFIRSIPPRKQFPIAAATDRRQEADRRAAGCPTGIPWAMIAPHEKQAKANHSQTLMRLAERGGLCPSEMLAVLEDREWRSIVDAEAIPLLQEAIIEWTNSSQSGPTPGHTPDNP